MMRWLSVAVLVIGTLLLGCREEQNPLPQFNKAMSYGGRRLAPLVVPARQGDRSLIGPAATADEVRVEVEKAASAPAPVVEEVASPAASPVEVDSGTARGAAQAFATFLQQGAYDRLGEVLAEPAREPVSRVVEAIRPLLVARKALLDALDGKFPNSGLRVTLPQALTFGLTEDWTVGEVTETGDGQAVAQVASADGQISTGWPLVRTDGTWGLMLPADVAFLTDPRFQGAITDAAGRLDRVRNEVAEGTIANVDQAAAAIDEAAEATAAQANQLSPLMNVR